MRQVVNCRTQASGAAASTEPTLPSTSVSPTTVPKWRSWNQAALSLSSAMKATDTPSPISIRPREASVSVAA